MPLPTDFTFDLSQAAPMMSSGMGPAAAAAGGGVSGNDVASALAGASKAFGAGQQQQGQGLQAPNPGQSPVGRGNPGALQNLMQMLMARQQAYQQAGQAGPGGGGVVPQTQRVNQPGLLGI